MGKKIGVLSDIHGNTAALEAVIKDSQRENIEEYWCLGDVFLPGPGGDDLWYLLNEISPTVFLRGNWEDCILACLSGDLDSTNPSDIYFARLTFYLQEFCNPKIFSEMSDWTMHQTKRVHQLNIGLSHALPEKNYGPDLSPIQAQENFDQLFANNEIDVAMFGHVHHQILRYSSEEQLIVNPGSVGLPFVKWKKLRKDLRAQYAILEIDDEGISEIHLKRVAFDPSAMMEKAEKQNFPYFDLYWETLKTGQVFNHNLERLAQINIEQGYKEEVAHFLDSLS